MTKNDANKLKDRWQTGEVITFFLQNGFSVIVDNPAKLDDISSTAITGTDATGRRFCAPLDYIQLGQIKQNKHK